jgi:hypothetical protein
MSGNTESGKVVIRPDVENYTKSRAASGAASMHTGDAVAKALEGANVDEVKKVASAMGLDDVNKYDKLNSGQIRMNLGNRIRGIVNKMEKDGEGTGVAKLEKAATPIRKAVAKRVDEAEKAAKAKEEAVAKAKAEKEAKAAAKAKKAPAKKKAA